MRISFLEFYPGKGGGGEAEEGKILCKNVFKVLLLITDKLERN